jgi:hypothetical protein
MESKKIYKDSYDEMVRIRKQLGGDNVSINFKKLDTTTKGMIMDALRKTIATRISSVQDIVLGPQ